MTVTAERYANWKAPANDGDFLIWPDRAALLADTAANLQLLNNASPVRIQNTPLPELRKAQRHWIGHTDANQPLLATGHQTELYHPGVWVKDALMHAAAAKLGAQAYHFAVDTDHPKHLNVRWPGVTLPITDDPAITTAAWCGQLESPAPAHLQTIREQIATAQWQWTFQPMLERVLDALRRTALDSPNLAKAITNAQHQLDWELGLRHHAMIVSPMLASEPYLAFAYHILARPEQFAGDYNTALSEYRGENGIASNMRPMPDLHVAEDLIESPFWLDDLATGTRKRAEVRRSADGWSLQDFQFDPKADGWTAARALSTWLRQHNLRLSPRALTLTMFLRLLVADQLIHGIGGGRYDQVTDRLIARHFGLTPPKFAVTTATLYFPGAVGRSRVCVSCVAQEGHRLKHSLLGDSKREILSKLNDLPRRSLERSLVFHNMHAALSAAAVDNPRLRDWEQRYREVEQRDREDEVIFDRELFYAMQTRERLAETIEQYTNAMS